MLTKMLKISLLTLIIVVIAGGLLFGTDLGSYLRSSTKSLRTSAKNAVPLDFELKRARDLLEEIIPEMHSHIRLIAQEEVEIAILKGDISRSAKALGDERDRIGKLRASLEVQQASYRFGNAQYSRTQIKEDLNNRFERFKEAEVVLASKNHLQSTREKSLQSAMHLLEQTRSKKRLLGDKINSLESQYRLVRASSTGAKFAIDNSKIAKTERLIANIKKRLDVAERVLAHESRFVQSIPVDSISDGDLIDQIDDYFEPKENSDEVKVARGING